MNDPAVRRSARCGPISVPNHKLVADVRWVAQAREEGIAARTDQRTAGARRAGAAIFVTGGTLFLKHPAYGPYDQTEDSVAIQIPPPGFVRTRVARRFSAYTRC